MASNSKSGNFTGKYGGSFTLSTNFNETSTNTLNNTSTISVSGSLKSNGGSFSATSKNASINIYWHNNKTNTDQLVKTKEFKSVSANQTISVSGTITVTHNDDGTLSGYSKIVYRDNGYGIPDKSTVQTANTNLTSIARKTTLVDAFGWNQEKYQAPMGISLNPRIGSDAFTHTLTYSYNTVTGTLFSKKKLVRSTDSNDVIAVILDEATFNSYNQDPSFNAVLFPKTVQEMASLIPNDKTLPIKFTLETFNGDTSLGTSEITFNFEVTGAKFDFNPTLQANDSLTKTLTGVSNKFIKGVSTVLASFGTAKSKNGATAKTYHYSNGNESYDLTTTSKVFSSVVNGNTEFLFAITDSRAFKTENQSKKIGTDYTLLNYSSPIISKVTVQRTESLSKKVNIACEGTFWNQSFGSKTNSITLTARYKVSGSSSWNTISSVKATVSGSKFSYSGQIAADIATDSGVEVEFTATDLCKAYSLKGSETKSTSIFDIGDDYFNINKELCNNYMPVPSYKIVNGMAQMLDYQGKNIYPETDLFEEVEEVTIE